MSNRTAQAIRHVGFEDLGSFAGPIIRAGYQIDYLEAATHDLRSIDPLCWLSPTSPPGALRRMISNDWCSIALPTVLATG